MTDSDLPLTAAAQETVADTASKFLGCSPTNPDDATPVIDSLTDKGWAFLGSGTARYVFRPPSTEQDRPVVVKFSRPYPPASEYENRGTGQNRTERRSYERLTNNPPDGLNSDWFAQVHGTIPTTISETIGGTTYTDAALIMEYLPTLRDAYPDAPPAALENIADEFSRAFRTTPCRPDAGIENVGLRVWNASDAPSLERHWDAADWCAYIDYGILNWEEWAPHRP